MTTVLTAKRCPRCGEYKPVPDGFHRDRNSPDSLYAYCKECNKARARKWKAENSERASETERRWREHRAAIVRQDRIDAWAGRNRPRVADRARPVIDLRRCISCNDVKPLDQFSPMPRGRAGRRAECKPCNSAQVMRRYRADPEEGRRRQRARYWAHAESRRARRRRWLRDNPAAAREARRRWYAADPELARERARSWRRNNPAAARAVSRMATQKRRALKRQTAISPFTREQLDARLSMFAGCWICGEVASTIDHVKPLSKGGPHILANLRPACAACNSRKHNTWPFNPEALRDDN